VVAPILHPSGIVSIDEGEAAHAPPPAASGAEEFVPNEWPTAVWSEATRNIGRIDKGEAAHAPQPEASGAEGFVPNEWPTAVWSEAT